MKTITKPTLIINELKCRKNIRKMLKKAQEQGVNLRPHFKTHQSLEIGQWFKEEGVSKITVSSLDMAQYFAAEWKDITVAFPVNILEIDTINELAQQIKLNVLVESVAAALFLKKHLKHALAVFIKIDVGTHRTGVAVDDSEKIESILELTKSSELMTFKGFLGHAGHTYGCKTKSEVLTIHNHSRELMSQLRQKYIAQYPDLMISLGDTPSCSLATDFSGVDEIRPGNFVYYDLMQHQIGSNRIDEIGVATACPIVAIHKERNELVLYGGGVHLSKERIKDPIYGTIYGKAVEITESGWGELIPDVYVKSLSQEHGIVSVPNQQIDNYEIGDYLIILPIHSCMTVNLMRFYENTSII